MKCKPGFHYVKKHFRISKNGSKHVVDEHCRKNPKSKENYFFKSNFNYIYDKLKDQYKYKKLKRIKGFSQDKGQYDKLIQFWLNYWKDQGLVNEEIDPLLIKALIAVESSFRERVITKMPNSSATGLLQITKTTMSILSRKISKEVKKAVIDISQDDAREANTNIAAGTRWVIFKITTSPWKNKKIKKDRMYGGVKYYHSWDSDGEDHANKVFKLYERSKK